MCWETWGAPDDENPNNSLRDPSWAVKEPGLLQCLLLLCMFLWSMYLMISWAYSRLTLTRPRIKLLSGSSSLVLYLLQVIFKLYSFGHSELTLDISREPFGPSGLLDVSVRDSRGYTLWRDDSYTCHGQRINYSMD